MLPAVPSGTFPVMARAVVLLLLPLALLAGCGGGGTKSNGEAEKTAAEILTDTKQAATSAKSVHFHGSIDAGGSPLKVDIRIDGSKGGTGSMTIRGAHVDIIRIGDEAYMKGSQQFYVQLAGAEAAKLLKGKWLKGSATTGDLASLADLTDMDKLFAAALKPDGTVSKGKETTVDGQDVIELKSSDGGSLYVATTGEPYPVELEQKSGDSTGAVHFDEWNEPVSVTAPKNAVDIAKLNG
jgi:hypothetical protein